MYLILSEQSNLIWLLLLQTHCVRDAQMMSDEFYKRGNQRQRLIVNKVSKKTIINKIIKDLDEIIDTIGVQLIGVIPEDNELIIATGKGFPLPYEAPSLIAFDAIARRIKGEDVPLTKFI